MEDNQRVRVQSSRKDKQQIAEMLRRGRESARVLRRAPILHQLDQGQTKTRVAANLGVVRKRVRTIARRYQQEGLESALQEKPRAGKPWTLDANQSQRIIAMVWGGRHRQAGKQFESCSRATS